MRKLLLPLLILALLGGAFVALFQAAPPAQSIRADAEKRLFAASFPDLAGRSQPLAQWRGKVLVVNFWATWCPPCRQEMPGFVALQRKYGARGLTFIGIALDEGAKVRAFVTENEVNYPVLLGEDDAVDLARAIGNDRGGLPFSALLDRNGKIVAAKVGAWDEKKLEALIEPLL